MTASNLHRSVLAAAALLASAGSASAASYTFTGQVPTGTDPLGGVYTAGPFGGGLVNFSENAGSQPDPTQQVLFDPTGSGLADATAFTFTITGSTDTILPLDRGFGNFFETFTPDSFILSDWDASVSADGKSITYTAGAGDALLPGQRFDTTTTFAQFNTLPADFAFTITWTGDAATTTGAVPEPATWAMMIGGFGLVGGALRRRTTLAIA